ncbi:MAG: hypothetical protein CL992_02630, partial [Euryarchaeota archaeon]|nr:hypothetical protein [Euryarchaeota archaeon]
MTWNKVLPTNQWSHIALVVPADNSRISASEMYVNGVKQTTFNSNSLTTRTNNYFDPGTDLDVRIGGDHFSCFFKGEMDDIRFHSRALGPQELGFFNPAQSGGLSSLTFPRSSAGLGPYSAWSGPLFDYGNPEQPGHLGLEITGLGALRLSITGPTGALILSTAKHMFDPNEAMPHHVAVRAAAGAPISPSSGISDERILSSYDIFFDGVSLPLSVERSGTDLGLSSDTTLGDGSVFSAARNSAGDYLPGSIDEMAIWSRSMSTDQILALSVALYDHSVDDALPRPDHAWSFEELQDGSFADLGGAVEDTVTEWELIAKHTGSNTNRFPSSARTDFLANPDDPDQPMFMSIGNLEADEYRNDQGKFKFKLVWGGYQIETANIAKEVVWTQTSWLTESSVLDFEEIGSAGYSWFTGLRKSTTNSCVIHSNHGWWNCVGTVNAYHAATPGPAGKKVYDVHLYVLPPENRSTYLTSVGAPATSGHESHVPDAISTVESLLIGGDIPEDGILRMPHLITPAGEYFNIDSNDDATCVIATDHEIVCWGQPPSTVDDTLTTTGAGSHARYPLPSTLGVPDDFAPIRVSLGGGGAHGGGCAVSSDGRVACWGLPSYDLSSSVFETIPALVELNDSSPVVDIAVSSSVTCALHQFGNMSCWGPAVDQVAVRTDAARLSEEYQIRAVTPPEGASALDSMPAVMRNSMSGDEWSVVWRTIDRLIAGENGICAEMNNNEHDDGQYWCIGYDDSGFMSNPNDIGIIANIGSGVPSNDEPAPPEFLTGLNFREYHGTWNKLPDFTQQTVVNSGTASVPDLTHASRSERYALVFTGFIDIPVSGSWTFSTVSDDGSGLYIDHTTIVNNDGLHGNRRKSGTVTLTEGLHAFKVAMFQKYGGRSLSVEWQGPGAYASRTTIPASAYKAAVAGDPLPSPATLAGDNLCHYAGDDGRVRCISLSGEASDLETTLTITDAPGGSPPIVAIDGTDEVVCLLFHPDFTSDDLDKQVGCYGSNQHGAMDSTAPSIHGSSLNLSHLYYPDWGAVSPPPVNFEAVDLSVSKHAVCLTSTMGEVFCWGDTDHGATGRGTDVAHHLVEKVTLPGSRKSATAYAAFSPATWDGDADGDGYTDSMEVACGSSTDIPNHPVDTDGATFLVWLDQGSISRAFFCDWLDRDADNDGFSNSSEVLCLTDPLDPSDVPTDSDGDGLCDGLDNDRDLDGFTTEYEEFCGSSDDDPLSTPPDADGDQLCDPEDDDDDGDGASDAFEIQCASDPHDAFDLPNDLDADLICDQFDNDKDGDGYLNGTEVRCGSSDMDALSVPDDMDGDSICDADDDDKDGDGFARDYEEHCGSSDDDINSLPPDIDG